MAGNGRPSKYEEYVEPYLDDIKKMALTMNERQIAQTLNISYSAFRSYKEKYSALKDALKKGRRQLVMELHSTLIKRAKGFQYEEKKIVKESGKPIREEIYTRTALPDVAALNLALKNFDPDNWANDPQMIRLREKELELREKQMEEKEW